MSDLWIELPQLRPLARQGKPYYAELRAIFKSEGQAIKDDVNRVHRAHHKLTVADVCRLALTHRINLKAMFDFLEDENILPCGTYDRLKDRGLRPMASLKEVWSEMEPADD